MSEDERATHRCKVCGALWALTIPEVIDDDVSQVESWHLISPACGPCCDNVPMADQIEAL